MKQIGSILEKNIKIIGADPATAGGFTQVPNFILTTSKLTIGEKMAYAMLLRYAWQNDFCFPGQDTLAGDMGVSRQSANTYIKGLEKKNYLKIQRRGLGKTNLYELQMTVKTKPN